MRYALVETVMKKAFEGERDEGGRPSSYKCRGFVGGPAASPAVGTNAPRNPVGGAPASVPTGTNISCA